MKTSNFASCGHSSNRSVGLFLVILITALFSGLVGCTPPGGGQNIHGSVPGLFGASEVWVILSSAPSEDETGPIVAIRGYGNTLEYLVVSKSIPASDSDDTNSDPVLVGLEFSIASIDLTDGVLIARAEFMDLTGNNIELQLTATICDAAITSAGAMNCELEAPALILTIGGESVDQQGISFRLLRLESCPKTLDSVAAANSRWLISSIPPVAGLLASAATAQPDTAGTLNVPYLIVSGSGTQANDASDLNLSTNADGGTCVRGSQHGDSVTPGAVNFDGSTLQIDISMAHINSTIEGTPEDGTCRASFDGDVTYCAVWSGLQDEPTAPQRLYRVDGVGERARATNGSIPFNHAYILLQPTE